MEELHVLGTGNATAVNSFNTCFIIKDGEEMFLTDSGGGNGLLKRMAEMDLELEKIHHVFISHLHMDHCLGVLWIIRVLSVKMQKGDYEGALYIYGPEEVLLKLDEFCRTMLRNKFYRMIGDQIFFVPVEPGEKRTICSWEVEFFDLCSKKTLQYGYRLRLKDGRLLVFAGDEPLGNETEEKARGADWLLREVLCCHCDEERFHAYAKKHDTVKEACESAKELEINNMVLWHLEDKTEVPGRKEKYLAEGEKWMQETGWNGVLYVPDDGDVIRLEENPVRQVHAL